MSISSNPFVFACVACLLSRGKTACAKTAKVSVADEFLRRSSESNLPLEWDSHATLPFTWDSGNKTVSLEGFNPHEPQDLARSLLA